MFLNSCEYIKKHRYNYHISFFNAFNPCYIFSVLRYCKNTNRHKLFPRLLYTFFIFFFGGGNLLTIKLLF